jgi:hypothetical protein
LTNLVSQVLFYHYYRFCLTRRRRCDINKTMFLLNTTTAARYACSLAQWHGALAAADENGWSPGGTVLDLAFQLFIHPEPNYLFENDLFVTLYVHHYCLQWNGDYRSPEHQLVRDDDCENFRNALEGTDADAGLMDFLAGGSFRICPD